MRQVEVPLQGPRSLYSASMIIQRTLVGGSLEKLVVIPMSGGTPEVGRCYGCRSIGSGRQSGGSDQRAFFFRDSNGR